jgi:hypothetical protein
MRCIIFSSGVSQQCINLIGSRTRTLRSAIRPSSACTNLAARDLQKGAVRIIGSRARNEHITFLIRLEAERVGWWSFLKYCILCTVIISRTWIIILLGCCVNCFQAHLIRRSFLECLIQEKVKNTLNLHLDCYCMSQGLGLPYFCPLFSHPCQT